MTKTPDLQLDSSLQARVDEACALLTCGKPIIFPTDTLYGLGVSVKHASGPDVLYQLKQRAEDKPVAWLVSGLEALDEYGADVSVVAQTLADRFWPGALTLIVKASESVPKAFTSQENTIGLRCPHSAFALSLIRQLGCPIATTSANISGEESVVDFASLSSELVGKVAGVFDDGEPKSGIASSVVDCTRESPILLRQGAVSVAAY